MSSLYREPAIDASYQVSVHLAKRFQRRRLRCEKLTDDRRRTTDDRLRTPSYGKSSHYLWQGELKRRWGGGIKTYKQTNIQTIKNKTNKTKLSKKVKQNKAKTKQNKTKQKTNQNKQTNKQTKTRALLNFCQRVNIPGMLTNRIKR
jgi:hypothetical protein